MNQDNLNNANNPGDEPAPLPGMGGHTPPQPPAYNDPEPPQYGDPVTPQPAGPPPMPPPPGLAPGPASTPPPPHYGDEAPRTGHGSLTNPTKDERNWAMFAHLSALAVGLLGSAVGMPIFSFIGPLVIYLMKKDESVFVADQAKEALNFNISIGIIMFVLFILTFTVILAILTIPLMILVGLGALILSVIGAIKASNGEVYRYPFTIRLIN